MIYFVILILYILLIKVVTFAVGMESSSPGDKRNWGIRLNNQLSLVLTFRMRTAVSSFPLRVFLTLQFPMVSTGLNTKGLF